MSNNVLEIEDDVLKIGERTLPLMNLRRSQRAWHELESAVKNNKQRLTSTDKALLEDLVIGESSSARRGWDECRQALTQAQLL